MLDRRALLARSVVGVAGLAGCAGGSVEASVNREITVAPGSGWLERLPPVGNAALASIPRGKSRFDVSLVDAAADEHYDAFTDGEAPGSMPRGEAGFSKAADPADAGDEFVATTADGGSRQSLPCEGPYYVIVDHPAYGRGTPLREDAGPIQLYVNLELVSKTLPV